LTASCCLLDVPTVEEARALVKATEGVVGVYKIGMELQFAGGLELARQLAAEGHAIFLDVKLHDIDNTIHSAVKNVAKMGMTVRDPSRVSEDHARGPERSCRRGQSGSVYPWGDGFDLDG
jgi:hypothetical protein